MVALLRRRYREMLMLSTCALVVFTTYYWSTHKEGVYDYDPARDRQFILDIFKSDWYWLVESPEFSAEYMLDNRTSSQRSSQVGDLTIKVYRGSDGEQRGFIAYHKKLEHRAKILFIATSPKFRGQGYGRKLLDYALNDLDSRGFSIVELITRTDNERAQALYRSAGFNEVWRNEKFVRFEKKLV